MERLAFLFLALAWAGAASGQGAGDDGPEGCVAGPSEPSTPPLRPQPVAVCGYGPAGLHARIDRLLAVREGRLGIEAVEWIFSLPPVTTTYDDPRSAEHAVILRSAPGHEAWQALIDVQESYGPDLASRPLRFRGPGRPARIDPRERGDILVHVVPLSLLAPRPPSCLSVAALLGYAMRRGWAMSPLIHPPSPHAPVGWQHMELIRDGLSFSTSFQDEKDCVGDFILFQPGNPRPRR